MVVCQSLWWRSSGLTAELLRTQDRGRPREDDGSPGTCKVALHSFVERQVWDLLMFLTTRSRSQDYYLRIIRNYNRTFQFPILGLKTGCLALTLSRGSLCSSHLLVSTLFFGGAHYLCTSFLILTAEIVTGCPCTTGIISINLPPHQSLLSSLP